MPTPSGQPSVASAEEQFSYRLDLSPAEWGQAQAALAAAQQQGGLEAYRKNLPPQQQLALEMALGLLSGRVSVSEMGPTSRLGADNQPTMRAVLRWTDPQAAQVSQPVARSGRFVRQA